LGASVQNFTQLCGRANFIYILLFAVGYNDAISRWIREQHQIVCNSWKKPPARLCPEIWQQKNWLLHHDNTPSHISFFTREFLIKNNKTIVLLQPYFSVSPIADKIERPPF
jgi:hypothetical protein